MEFSICIATLLSGSNHGERSRTTKSEIRYTMDLNENIHLNQTKVYLVYHAFLVILVFLGFRAGLDNFFAGDDFNWLFDTEKMMLYPPHFFEHSNHSYFFRPTESLYFVINFLLAGFNHYIYQLTALLIHLVNVILVSLVVSHICKNRLAGLIAALFWGLNYKHVEAVFRPYGVADSLALLFCLGALWLFLHKRTRLAPLCLFFGLVAKENAALFPFIVVLYVYEFETQEKKRWLQRTIPLWIVTCLAGGLAVYIRTSSESYGKGYLTVTWHGLNQFWETLFTFIGPDIIYIKMVYLEGDRSFIPTWGAILLWIGFAFFLWKIPRIYRFGFLWMAITTLPTVFVYHQTSRYYYIPLVGLGIVAGQSMYDLLRYSRQKQSQLALFAVMAGFICIIIYFIIGINLEEQDYDFFGDIHWQAAQSFKRDILPTMPRDAQTMAIFLKPDSKLWAEELYAKFLSKAWYLPVTYKWVFRRHEGVLGLSNTYGFVTYCAYHEVKDTLFVNVSYEEYQKNMLAGDFYIIFHDYETNTFNFGSDTKKAELIRHRDDEMLYRFLQPGRFDPMNTGKMYF